MITSFVKVISATEAISEGAEGILLESLLEGLAEYYSVELGVKVSRGLTEMYLLRKVDTVRRRKPFHLFICT